MTQVRFYMYEHGLRLQNEEARRLVREIADVDHPHIDVVQLHRVDNLTFSNGDPVMTKLDGDLLRSALVDRRHKIEQQ